MVQHAVHGLLDAAVIVKLSPVFQPTNPLLLFLPVSRCALAVTKLGAVCLSFLYHLLT